MASWSERQLHDVARGGRQKDKVAEKNLLKTLTFNYHCLDLLGSFTSNSLQVGCERFVFEDVAWSLKKPWPPHYKSWMWTDLHSCPNIIAQMSINGWLTHLSDLSWQLGVRIWRCHGDFLMVSAFSSCNKQQLQCRLRKQIYFLVQLFIMQELGCNLSRSRPWQANTPLGGSSITLGWWNLWIV